MYATTEDTIRYIDRFPRYRGAASYRAFRLPDRAAIPLGATQKWTNVNPNPSRDHVLENLGVAHVAPVTHEPYLRLYL